MLTFSEILLKLQTFWAKATFRGNTTLVFRPQAINFMFLNSWNLCKKLHKPSITFKIL
ncbi:hypothetical protein [Helicobacter bilis]|uniref:hypothetical protein n=1 Tax=Helicobacter bilis TaxID=37372 RepID=UPI0013150FB5|nr:hypothetical protein [Helicobacter bilis]